MTTEAQHPAGAAGRCALRFGERPPGALSILVSALLG
ncbi:hypothetical protein HNR68_003376 [Saccharopolyspora hordei]|uniref:Uncharacterized protein n=1 Tax=Saccharopolyspora hordei TaxID=1838 RepID=A0A853ALU6_9PSEU|nr:hypothetical protein [Saccharopolyspora hordei]